MELVWRDFAELSRWELHDWLRLRAAVFVLEQRSFYEDIDGRDLDSRHLLAGDPAGRLLGGLRLMPPAGPGQPVKIGRVALLPEARGRGLGAALLREALAEAARRHPGRPLFLSAQRRQVPFYSRLGFAVTSEPYDDGGIEHLDMLRPPGPAESGPSSG